MLMLRSVAFGLCVGSVVAAHASFELMLLPGADGRIHRYDPVNNINLGSYRTFSTTTMVTADLNGTSYSSTNGNTQFYAHNYSTGLASGSVTGATSNIASLVVNGSLYVMTTSGVSKYNTITGSFQGQVLAGGTTTFRAMTSYGNRMIVLGYNSTGAITSQTFDMTTLVSSVVNTYGTTATIGSNMGRAASIRNEILNTSLVGFTYITNSGSLAFARIPVNSDGTITNLTLTQSFPTQIITGNLLPSVLAGHNSVYLYGQDSTTATDARLIQYEMGTGLTQNTSTAFTAPGLFRTGSHNFQAAILVAPEPGTMIGLGLGLAAILKRRRSRA